MKIIGVAGRAGAGKDTIADYLVSDYNFRKRGFADALYEEVAQSFEVSISWLRDRRTKELPAPALALSECRDIGFLGCLYNVHAISACDRENFEAPRSPRWILQHWGTEYRRGQVPDYWVKRLANYVRTLQELDSVSDDIVHSNAPIGVVIPDVRFANEASWVRSVRASKIWHVERDAVVQVNSHDSENGIAIHVEDSILYNSGTIYALQDTVDTLME